MDKKVINLESRIDALEARIIELEKFAQQDPDKDRKPPAMIFELGKFYYNDKTDETICVVLTASMNRDFGGKPTIETSRSNDFRKMHDRRQLRREDWIEISKEDGRKRVKKIFGTPEERAEEGKRPWQGPK